MSRSLSHVLFVSIQFTDADAFEVTFPTDASVDQKAALVGTAVFLNAAFFEAQEGDDGAGVIASAL